MVLCSLIAVCLVPYFYQLALPGIPVTRTLPVPVVNHTCWFPTFLQAVHVHPTPVTPVPSPHTQVSNPSSERRTLIAQLLGSLSSRVDLGSQAHVLLTQLHRLAEDRIDQVGHFWV